MDAYLINHPSRGLQIAQVPAGAPAPLLASDRTLQDPDEVIARGFAAALMRGCEGAREALHLGRISED